MSERHESAEHILCVISQAYLKAPYSSWERQAAEWAAASTRPNFALPVKIEECELPTLSAILKRGDLHGLKEDEARATLEAFLKPAEKPIGPIAFPGAAKPATDMAKAPARFPGGPRALSNIPISVPRFFLGRDEVLAEIKTALVSENGRAAITALHGMRGVGKTSLAAAYADRHRGDYRATWWIRAATESTLRADLVGLGVRLGWVVADEKEEPAIATVMERLCDEGAGILLIYDNAIDADSIEAYLPDSGDAQVLATSNSHAWRDVAMPLEIDTWPPEIGADYQRDAPRAFHNRLTAARAFALAIDEATRPHPAAEPLIGYAALLAPEPIPLFLFSEAREQLGGPLASALAEGGLDEALAALRAFALLDRETIPDERDPSITTDCVRLHRLVRQVAAARFDDDLRQNARRGLVEAMAAAYPATVHSDSRTWPRARRLDSLAMALVSREDNLSGGSELAAANLLGKLDSYRDGALAAYAEALPLSKRALAICEKALGPAHPTTQTVAHNTVGLLEALKCVNEAKALRAKFGLQE